MRPQSTWFWTEWPQSLDYKQHSGSNNAILDMISRRVVEQYHVSCIEIDLLYRDFCNKKMRIYIIYITIHDIRKNSIYYRPGNCHHARICGISERRHFWIDFPHVRICNSESRCNFFGRIWCWSGEPKPIVHFFVQCWPICRLSLTGRPIVSLI